jgi:hypothetical protein
MDLDAGKIVLNGAPSQYDRRLPALDPGYAPVDGRSFSELLDFPVRYGALINFYDLRDEKDGDWVGFFLSDPTMMLAALDCLDFDSLDREFARIYERTRAAHIYARKFDLLCELFTFIQGLARRVNDALVAFNPVPERGIAQQLRQALIESIVTSLGPQLRQLKAYAEGAGDKRALGQEIPLDWSGFLPIWGLRDDCPDASIYRGLSRTGKIDHALPHLTPIFAAFRESFADLQSFARDNLEASLAESDHKPQIGLYIAFAKLFETAQATINTMSSRYVHFYYHDILRERPAGAVGDRVHLAFTLAADETVRSTSVPAGTQFPAGQDAEGRDILYASEKALTVTAAALDIVRTLHVARGFLTRDPNSALVTQRVLGADVLLAEAIAKSLPWPTFGSDDADASPASVAAPVTLGFAVSSPVLVLTGGERDIRLAIGYSEMFKADRLDPMLGEIAAVTGLAPDAVLRAVLDGAFDVLASTGAGWFPISSYETEVPNDAEASFSLRLRLPDTAPPIVAYDPAPEEQASPGANPAPDLPTLKFYLRQQAVRLAPSGGGAALKVYPLSLLDGMPVETLDIAVAVTGLTDLALRSTIGALDPATPFALFGAPAVVGSYLDIGKEELFAKRLAALDLTIGWFNLPANADGFKGYYRDYTIGLDGLPEPDLFDNAVFLGSIEVVNPGTWTIVGDDTDLCLFRTQPFCNSTDAEGTLCPSTCFDFPADVLAGNTPPDYYTPADGVLRVTLTAPAYGFGDDLYAQNVLYCVLADLPDTTQSERAAASSFPSDDLAYPNAPWLPMAQRVAVAYSAEGTLLGGGEVDGVFFHLLPFGGYARASAPTPLLPVIADEGSLYLGFSNLAPPQGLTLLFQMAASGSAGDGGAAPVRFEYLSREGWQALASSEIAADGTNGLENSGILALSLPAYDPHGSTMLADDRQWLRASVATGTALFPDTIGVYPNAATAHWLDTPGAGQSLATPLPAQTITASVQPLPYIDTIAQPMESFGGRPPETRGEFQMRLGERLRHKDRAVVPWDYERLVLARFPTVWKVQALPARNTQQGGAPGDVLVVAVAGPDTLDVIDPTVPTLSGEMLGAIRCTLEGRTSPFVRLQVVNPVYVRIAVTATVQFSESEDVGAAVGRLNDELVRYLSPWFYDAARAAKGGRYADPDEIEAFIETQPGVDALLRFEIAYDPPTERLDWYFLTSAQRHDIVAVPVRERSASCMPI